MPALLKQTEATPAAWPAAPAGLTAAAAALSADMIWQRIEGYICFRWTARQVVWTVEGPGDWELPLQPATLTTAERWTGDAWENVTLQPGPCGLSLPLAGPYRLTATVGAGTVPAAVNEAFRRLAEYSASIGDYGSWKGAAGATSNSFNLSEGVSYSTNRYADWQAKSMINSGAADLLRPYRRA